MSSAGGREGAVVAPWEGQLLDAATRAATTGSVVTGRATTGCATTTAVVTGAAATGVVANGATAVEAKGDFLVPWEGQLSKVERLLVVDVDLETVTSFKQIDYVERYVDSIRRIRMNHHAELSTLKTFLRLSSWGITNVLSVTLNFDQISLKDRGSRARCAATKSTAIGTAVKA
ncbi:hypothetical protein MLD38_035574 [Melastoma candidum]|uniref:Uncharacterized protein n=1 Tax=Melastoma candidum TaxID=119954 RepID=A0ACB9LHP5_9MYRT|nr:hypothetical protein MLD38_035574 [Melastoma candidum]